MKYRPPTGTRLHWDERLRCRQLALVAAVLLLLPAFPMLSAAMAAG